MATIGLMSSFEPDNAHITAYLERMQLFIEVNGIAEEKLLIRAYPADSQCHTLWNGSLAVSGVAAVDVEILVCVSWFHMKVSLQVAISNIHSCVQKHY